MEIAPGYRIVKRGVDLLRCGSQRGGRRFGQHTPWGAWRSRLGRCRGRI